MARLALVSRNPMMSMGLTSSEHDVEEIRASALDDWLAEGNDSLVDALILDLGSPSQALRLVGDLRASHRWIPTLLVIDDAADWQLDDLQRLPGVDFLPLPLDPDKLQRAVQSVLRHPVAPPAPPVRPLSKSLLDPLTTPLLDEVEEPPLVVEPSLLVHEELVDDVRQEEAPDIDTDTDTDADADADADEGSVPLEDVPVIEPVARPVTESVVEPIAPPIPTVVASSEPIVPVEIPVRAVVPDTPTDVVDPEPKPRPRRAKKSEAVRRSTKNGTPKPSATQRIKASKPAQEPKPSSAKPRRRATDHLDDQGTAAMVAALIDAQTHLYTLAEASEVILDDAIRRAEADAGALLVPDGNVWRVSAGSGVRPIEFRYQLTVDSWLIERVGASQRGILILDTDIARSDLRGAPLASRSHLMAVPVPSVGAVLLLARDNEPTFHQSNLGELSHVAAEAGPLLERALAARSLARTMQRHLDPES